MAGTSDQRLDSGIRAKTKDERAVTLSDSEGSLENVAAAADGATRRPRAEVKKSPEPEVMYCVNHPHTETLIRCARCLDPICPKCQVRTPVGIKCKKCASVGRPEVYIARPQHILYGLLVGLPLAIIAGALVARLGFLLVFILSAPVGGLIGETMGRVARKRGRIMQLLAAGCIVVGALLAPVTVLVVIGGIGALGMMTLGSYLVWLGLSSILYVVLASGAAIAALR